MKKCSACKLEKSFDNFHTNKITSDGYGSQCTSCDASGRRAKCREKKQSLVNSLGGKCSICGYNKCLPALEFHHQDEKLGALSELMKKSFKFALEEVKKCILVCANCHREIHEEEKDTITYGGNVRKL